VRESVWVYNGGVGGGGGLLSWSRVSVY